MECVHYCLLAQSKLCIYLQTERTHTKPVISYYLIQNAHHKLCIYLQIERTHTKPVISYYLIQNAQHKWHKTDA
jgi:hypothetical protein